MKKIYAMMVLLSLSLTAFAQGGRDLYEKYSDQPGISAVYISPAMFRLIGKIPDMELQDESVNLTPLIKSMSGFYSLSTEDRATSESLYADVKKFVKSGRYELLMETKDDGQVLRMYTVGNEKTVESFVMVTKEDSEVSVISFDGKMDREQMENILAEAAR
jgi:hypothetical protein